MEKLGKIEILAERKVNMVELDVDVDDKTVDKVAAIGLRLIRKDKSALFNYAFVKALENATKGNDTWTIKSLPKRSSRRSQSRKS